MLNSSRIIRTPPSYATGGTVKDNRLPIPTRTSANFQVPGVDEALINHLLQVFPVTVLKDRSLRDYDRSVGHQEVIDHLLALLEEQNKKV